MDGFPSHDAQPGVKTHDLTMVGTGASVPTKVLGQGITLTRTGAGDCRATWAENPGTYVRTAPCLRATTESDLKNYSLVVGTWDATNWTLDFVLYNGSGTATDLQAAQWIELGVRFKETSG